MRLTICLLTTFLFLISNTLANDVSLSDIEQAMMSLVTKVRGEQTLIFPHVNTSPSAVRHGDYYFVNSVLSAVVPKSDLVEAKKDPDGFARIPFSQRPWYTGLPADVKEYLRAVEKAEEEIMGRAQPRQQDGQRRRQRIRGVGWWWELR
ncbi:MAG: hypothetical protein Q9191_004413 [Dirinaria sp. TL-2023a]